MPTFGQGKIKIIGRFPAKVAEAIEEEGYFKDTPEETTAWIVKTGTHVFAVTDDGESAAAVRNALRSAGLQGPSSIEPIQ